MPKLYEMHDGGAASRIGDVVITGVDDDIDLPPELMPIDVEADLAGGAAKSDAPASWSWHASQWLKGGAAMVGVVALGSLGYLTRNSWGSTSGSSVEADSFGLVPSQGDETGLTLHEAKSTSDITLSSRSVLHVLPKDSVEATEIATTPETDSEISLDLIYPKEDSERRERRALVEFKVNTVSDGSQENPSIAALADGGFVIVWQRVEGGFHDTCGIFGQLYNSNGNVVGEEFAITEYTTIGRYNPAVAAFSQGGFVVVWQSDEDGYEFGICGQRYNVAGTAQGTKFQINSYTYYSQKQPAITALSNGGFVVVWQSYRQDDSGYGIYGQRYDFDGSTVGDEFRVNSYTAYDQQYPAVAAFSDGGFIVVWQRDGQYNSGYGIYGQRYDADGVAQGTEFQINSHVGYFGRIYPVVTTLANGSFIVVWQSCELCYTQSNNITHGKYYDASGAVKLDTFSINTYASHQYPPSIAALIDDSFIITWSGVGGEIYGQHYDINGIRLGKNFPISTNTRYSQINPSVVGLTEGGFVVTWQNEVYYSDSYSDFDISGRFFSPPKLITNELTISEGDIVIVTTAILDSYDIDNDPETINIIVSSVQHGQFEYFKTYGVAITSFTQKQIVDRDIQFVHDGGELAPSYSISLSDGIFTTKSETATITFIHINDAAPVLDPTKNPQLTAIEEDTIDSSGNTIAEIIVDGSITDADDGEIKSIAVTSADDSSGTWEYLLAGSMWIAVNPVSDIAGLLLDSSCRLRFNPIADWHGDVSFTFRAWDKSTGYVGSKVNTSDNGDKTAFSIASGTGFIKVISVTDAPRLDTTVTPRLASILEDNFDSVGDDIASILVGGSIVNPDGPVQKALTVIAVDEEYGRWEYLLGGSNWLDVSPVDDRNSLLLESTSKMRFIPQHDWNGEAYFTFRVWAHNIGVTGTKVDTTENGGTTQFSSDFDDAIISVTVVNDAPVLADIHPMLTTIIEDDSDSIGDTVASIVGDGSITDVDIDGSAPKAIAIIYADSDHGVWEFTIDGASWHSVEPVSGSSALLLDSLHRIRFIPEKDWNGEATFDFRAWDKSNSVTVGTKVDITYYGGTTPYSATFATVSIYVTPVHDAPVLNSKAHPVLIPIDEDTFDSVGDTVESIIIDGSISSIEGMSVKAMAIIEIDERYGTWEYVCDGDGWKPISPASSINSLLLDSSHKVRFVPNLDFNGYATFSFRAWDKSGGIAGAKVDTSVNGGTTAFSSATNIATIDVIAVDDIPVLTKNVLTIEQGTTVLVTPNMLKATDVDDDLDTLVFSFSDIVHGRFERTANPGDAIVSFTQRDITSGLIQFVHDGSQFPPSYFVSISDGIHSAEPVAANVTFRLANDAPILDPSATPSLTAIDEDTANPVGDTIDSIIVDGSITDADGPAVKAMAIVTVDDNHGIWQYSLDGEVWHGITPVSITKSLLLDSRHKIRFIPDPDWNGDAKFIFRAWDKSVGVAGAKVDTSVNGGTTAFSSATNIATIDVIAVDDIPVLTKNVLTIEQGTTVLITANMLKATDVDDDLDTLVFSFSDIVHGRFERTANPGDTIVSFTQGDISSGLIQFVHDGSRFPPSYLVSVNDGTHSTEPVAASVTFRLANDAPILDPSATPSLTAIDEDTANPVGDTIDSIIVDGSIADVDGPAIKAMAVVTVDDSYGVWQYSLDDGETWNGIAPVSITKSLLLDSMYKIRFVPDQDWNGEGDFIFRAWDKSDGIAGAKVDTSVNGGTAAFSHDTNMASITVRAVNDAPVLIDNTLTIEQGASVLLTRTMLSATDVDHDPETLMFMLSAIQHGKFTLVSDPKHAIMSFKQEKISQGEVQFVHDGKKKAPSYEVMVSDGDIITDPVAAIINFSSRKVISDDPEDPKERFTNAAIAAGISGSIGLMFLILKIYVNRKAAKHFDELISGKGGVGRSDKEFRKNVLNPIAKEVFNTVKITGFVGYINKKTMRKYIAAVIALVDVLQSEGLEVESLETMSASKRARLVSEIARQVNNVLVPRRSICSRAYCVSFFKPEIRPEDLEHNLDVIAQAVKLGLTVRERGRSLAVMGSDTDDLEVPLLADQDDGDGVEVGSGSDDGDVVLVMPAADDAGDGATGADAAVVTTVAAATPC